MGGVPDDFPLFEEKKLWGFVPYVQARFYFVGDFPIFYNQDLGEQWGWRKIIRFYKIIKMISCPGADGARRTVFINKYWTIGRPGYCLVKFFNFREIYNFM